MVKEKNLSAELILERAAEKAARVIETAVEKALQKISDSEISASKRVAADAANAATALNMKNAEGGSDHDNFLIFSSEVKIKLDTISADVKDLKTGTSAQLIDHELRLKKLETKTANYFITLTLYSIALGFLISLLVYHLIK